MSFWDWANLVSAVICGGFVVWSNDRSTRVVFAGALAACVMALVQP